MSDRPCSGLTRETTPLLCDRWGMDLANGLEKEQHVDRPNVTAAPKAGKPLTGAQWLVRCIFLESIAGVPGMVAGMGTEP